MLVVLPNNVVAKEAITNYSEPTAPVRTFVDVGASYDVPPTRVKAACAEAVRQCPMVLQLPSPDVLLHGFDASSIAYRTRFWIDDPVNAAVAQDQVRTAIYYAFQRQGIEIPFPIQVEYGREWKPTDPHEQTDAIERVLARIDLFSGLDGEFRREMALAAARAVYGAGETIVRQGDAGQSMFVVATGEVSVVIEPGRNEVARIQAGGYFGEMTLLTGEPRTATVLAVGDVEVIEIAADLFRRLASVHTAAIEHIAEAAVARRAGLEVARNAVAASVGVTGDTLMARMKKFLRFR
jgi:hypothetical protein